MLSVLVVHATVAAVVVVALEVVVVLFGVVVVGAVVELLDELDDPQAAAPSARARRAVVASVRRMGSS